MSSPQSESSDAQHRPSASRLIPGDRPRAERYFTQDVIEVAQSYGWLTYHIQDKTSAPYVRGKGFPDLVMYRGSELIVAELKRDEASQLFPEQIEWLAAFRQHVPGYEWRPSDWDEIEHVLEHGAGGRWPNEETAAIPTGDLASASQIPTNFGRVITGLAETIEDSEFDRGDKARLRRMDPNNPETATFWKLMQTGGMPRNPEIRKWGLIIHGMALMSHGTGLTHNPRVPVGRALFQGGGQRAPFYSEQRLSTLLAARGPTLHSLLARLFRMFSTERCALNWREMAWFILNEGYDEDQTEQARVEIARAYYEAERRHSQATSGS